MKKKIIKKFITNGIYDFIKFKWKRYKLRNDLNAAYKYDFNRYFNFSYTQFEGNKLQLIAKIIREYHVIEKGLTMPVTRLGFGKGLVLTLSRHCYNYITKYEPNNDQIIHATGVVLEYELLHAKNNFELDSEVKTAIYKLKQISQQITTCPQKEITRIEYFRHVDNSFPSFSQSRSSVRNYSIEEDIPMEKLNTALQIAQSTPSACNRQCWRTHVFINKDKIFQILEAQGGNRGFGHLSNKLIVITAETTSFSGSEERNEVFIDGGMYAMNLLYALHSQEIAGCILNCSFVPSKDKELRKLCKIKESQVFIAMISCGIPPESFKIASSPRFGLEQTNKLIVD